MTPQIQTIILSNGEVLSDQGVERKPKTGDWYRSPYGDVLQARGAIQSNANPILTPLEQQGQKIERRGDCSLTVRSEVGEAWTESANPLIDAACAVVNTVIKPDPVTPAMVANLFAALEPFTQPVKPKDQYYVEQRGSSFYVMDAEWQVDYVGKFEYEQDAEDFAAMKNSQDGE